MLPRARHLLLFAVLMLAGCTVLTPGDKFQSEYRFIPPKSIKVRNCIASCEADKSTPAYRACYTKCGGKIIEDRLCPTCDDTQIAPVATPPLGMSGEDLLAPTIVAPKPISPSAATK